VTLLEGFFPCKALHVVERERELVRADDRGAVVLPSGGGAHAPRAVVFPSGAIPAVVV